MKKLILSLVILGLIGQVGLAQSKTSYSLQVNNSASLDDTYSVCIYRTTGGVCLDMEAIWKLNFTFSTNYQLNKHVRLQAGVGYTQLNQDALNKELGKDVYKLKFLSIPVKAHYFVNQGATRFYFGAGLRTDIRLNKSIAYVEGDGVLENTPNLNLSAEALIGVEVRVMPQLSLSLEPTYSKALTNYHKENPNFNALNQGIIAEKPQRVGFTFVVTYGL